MKIIHLATVSVLVASGCALEAPTGSSGDVQDIDQTASSTAAVERSPGGPNTLAPHCVVSVSSSQVSCYPTFQAAIAFATGGKITDAPDARTALADDGFARRINELAIKPNISSVVISIEYQDINFQGATLVYQNDFGCDGDPNTMDFSVVGLPTGWNDVISSFHSFSNCQQILFENVFFGGATTQKAADLAGLGAAMNDRASSIQWF